MRALDSMTSPVGCSTGQQSPGWSSMWTELGKLPGNVRSRRWNHCLLPIVVSIRCARQAIKGASEEKWYAPARFCSRRIHISFSARLEDQAMGITEANCGGR